MDLKRGGGNRLLGAFARQYGLPCRHMVHRELLLHQPLHMGQINAHWNLYGEQLLPAEDLELRGERDPVRVRGWRTRNGPQPTSNSTRCEAAHDAPHGNHAAAEEQPLNRGNNRV
ncbi:hypothetical protein GQ53DRAFT_744029 [Thozetella sp. PMI_491]|nr:hypothetical protein GQ53DRAFT_744029 [Thozetella sp. PMI_491]